MSAASASRASAAARQGAGPGAAAGPRNAMPASVVRAVRTIDRWALVAGVTGLLANVLLVVLFTTRADGRTRGCSAPPACPAGTWGSSTGPTASARRTSPC